MLVIVGNTPPEKVSYQFIALLWSFGSNIAGACQQHVYLLGVTLQIHCLGQARRLLQLLKKEAPLNLQMALKMFSVHSRRKLPDTWDV